MGLQGVQKIITDLRMPYMVVERTATAEEMSAKNLSNDGTKAYNLIRESVEIQEYDVGGNKSSCEQLHEMFMRVADEDLFVSHILVGSTIKLRQWIKYPRKHTTLFGVPVYQLEQLPEETIILCGSGFRDAEADDIEIALKGIML